MSIKIVRINLNEIGDEYNIDDIEGYTLIQRKFIKENTDDPQLILTYSDTIHSGSFIDKLTKNKKIDNEKIVDLFKDDKSKLMLYYYLRSKRVVLAYKYKVELFEILTNESLYTLIDKQVKISTEFNSNSSLKKFKLYKDDLLNYCKDFYSYQLPTDENLYNKLSNYYVNEWNINLNIQRKEIKNIKNGNLLNSNINNNTNPDNSNISNNTTPNILNINTNFISPNNTNNAILFNNIDIIQDVKISDVIISLL